MQPWLRLDDFECAAYSSTSKGISKNQPIIAFLSTKFFKKCSKPVYHLKNDQFFYNFFKKKTLLADFSCDVRKSLFSIQKIFYFYYWCDVPFCITPSRIGKTEIELAFVWLFHSDRFVIKIIRSHGAIFARPLQICHIITFRSDKITNKKQRVLSYEKTHERRNNNTIQYL